MYLTRTTRPAWQVPQQRQDESGLIGARVYESHGGLRCCRVSSVPVEGVSEHVKDRSFPGAGSREDIALILQLSSPEGAVI